MKPFLKFLAAISLMAFLGLLALSAIINSSFIQKQGLKLANSFLEDHFDVVVSYDNLNVSMLPPGLTINSISISSSSSKDVLVNLDFVDVDVSIISLFLAKPKLSNITVSGLHIDITENKIKNFVENLTSKLSKVRDIPKKKPKTIETIPLETLTLANSTIKLALDTKYKNENFNFISKIDQVKIAFPQINTYMLNGRLSGLKILTQTKDFMDDTEVEFAMSISDTEIKIDEFLIQSRENLIHNKGTIKIGKDISNTKIIAESDIRYGDFSLLGNFLDIPNTNGTIKGNAKTEIILPSQKNDQFSLMVLVNAESRDAQIYNYKLLDTQTTLLISENGITFKEINIKEKNKSYGFVNGYLNFDDNVNLSFDYAPTSLPFSTIAKILNIPVSDNYSFILNSDSIKVTGQGSPFSLKVDGSGKFSELLANWITDKNANALSCESNFGLTIDSNKLQFNTSKSECSAQEIQNTNTTKKAEFNSRGEIFFSNDLDYKITADISKIDMPILAPYVGRKILGHGKIETSLTGNKLDVKGTSKFSLSELSGFGVSISSIIGRLTFDKESIKWRNITGKIRESSGVFVLNRGSIKLAKVTEIKLQGEIGETDNLQVFTFDSKDNIPITTFDINNIQFDINLIPTRILRSTGTATLNVSKLHIKSERILDELNVKLNLHENNSNIQILNLSSKNLEIAGNISSTNSSTLISNNSIEPNLMIYSKLKKLGLTYYPKLKLNLTTTHTDSQNLTNIEQLPYIREILIGQRIKGNLNFNANLDIYKNSFNGVVKTKVNNISIFENATPNLSITSFFENTKISNMFTMSGNSLKGRLNLSTHNLDQYDLVVFANRFNIKFMNPTKLTPDPRNYIYINGDASLKGRFTEITNSKGTVNLKSLMLKFNQDIGSETKSLNAKLLHPVSITNSRGHWLVDKNTPIVIQGKGLKFEALVNSMSHDNLEVLIVSEFHLGLLPNLIKQIESATGVIRGEGYITGSLKEPKFSLKFNDLKKSIHNAGIWSPVSISVFDIRPPLKNISFDAELTNEKISLNYVKAEKGNGWIESRGDLYWREGSKELSNLLVKFNNAKIIYPVAVFKAFEVNLTGNVSISGVKAPYKVFGDIELTKARNTKDFNIRSEIFNAFKARQITQATQLEDPTLLLDINIKCDEDIKISTKNLVATLSTNLNLKGNNITPIILGNVEVNRGRFIYKRDFEFTRGILSFDSQLKIDPILDVAAMAEISPYRVYLTITGEASNPIIEFTVDPPYRPDGTPISTMDILVLLSRGKLPEATKVSGETREALTSEAINLLGGIIEQPVERFFELSGQKYIQRVYVDTFVSENSGTGIRLNLPINLSEDFDVIFRTETAEEQSSKLGVTGDYSLHKNVSITAGLDDLGQGKTEEETVDGFLDLRFRFTFP